VPDNLEIITERIPEAQIRARGPAETVRRMVQTDVHVTVDLQNVRPGEHTYDLTSAQVRLPLEVEVVQVVPAQLHLAFDRQGHRQLPIRPRLTGLAPGALPPAITVDPATALVIGPAKRVENTDTVLTDAIDLGGASLPATFSGVHIYVADPLVRVAQPASVTVKVTASAARGRPRGAVE